MLVEANREPPDIVIYTNGSVTRNRSGWGFLAKQRRRIVHVSMRYLPNLQPREARHKVEQVKVYLSAMQRPKNSLRPNPPRRCQRRKGGQGLLRDSADRQPIHSLREWPAGKANAEVQCSSKPTASHMTS